MKTVYSFDWQTGEFLGEDQAQPSPMEPGKYLMPACSTELQPPVAGANECAVFRDGKWSIVSDWRFVRHWDLETGKLCEPIVELGQEPTKTQTSQEPALPELAAHQALEWDKKAKAFKTIPDWRGVPLWSTKTAMFDPISKLGQELGDRTEVEPDCPFPKWNGTTWETDTDAEAQFLLIGEIQEQENYLLSTDWMVIRQTETGKPMPADITQARQTARERISALKVDLAE